MTASAVAPLISLASVVRALARPGEDLVTAAERVLTAEAKWAAKGVTAQAARFLGLTQMRMAWLEAKYGAGSPSLRARAHEPHPGRFVERICEGCDTAFPFEAYRVGKQPGRYCSTACAARAALRCRRKRPSGPGAPARSQVHQPMPGSDDNRPQASGPVQEEV